MKNQPISVFLRRLTLLRRSRTRRGLSVIQSMLLVAVAALMLLGVENYEVGASGIHDCIARKISDLLTGNEAKRGDNTSYGEGGDTGSGTPPVIDPTPVSLGTTYEVPAYAQPTNMSCWATAIAMMVSWKHSMSIAPEAIAERLGYTTQFQTGGLHPEDTKVFEAWGLKWEPPMSYTVDGLANLLKSNGPLWIAGNPQAPHVRVITGITGDGTPNGTHLLINDPAGGKQYESSFAEAMKNMEGLGSSESGYATPIYIAHF